MIGERFPEHEAPKSRRELRRERRLRKRRAGLGKLWAGIPAGFLVRRAPSAFEVNGKRVLEEAPKSRRARREQQRLRKRRAGISELLVTVLIAFVVVFGFVRPLVAEAFRIPSVSMVPTLEVGDRILANKFIYRFSEPQRGDIVVFRDVEGGYETLIKRVVGVEGDEIQVQDGLLFVNGEQQEEPYLNEKRPPRDSYGPTTVPEGHVFVMGDNRGNSGDSRLFGPVPLENLKGQAFLRFWPVTKIEPFFGVPQGP